MNKMNHSGKLLKTFACPFFVILVAISSTACEKHLVLDPVPLNQILDQYYLW